MYECMNVNGVCVCVCMYFLEPEIVAISLFVNSSIGTVTYSVVLVCPG